MEYKELKKFGKNTINEVDVKFLIQPLVGGENPDKEVADVKDFSDLKIRFAPSNETGIGKELVYNEDAGSVGGEYVFVENAIVCILPPTKADEANLTIIGKYGGNDICKTIKLFFGEYQTEDTLSFEFEIVKLGGGESGGGVVETTYADLVALRDGGELSAGTWYRITDYATTTTQSETMAAGHDFDLLVLALDGKTLSERAKAIAHIGDTYFSTSNLSAWDVWYCLDNDADRFAWADVDNGKGIIYRLIDEYENDCPYDFKNILFLVSTSYASRFYAYTFNWHNNATNSDASVFGNDGTLLNDEEQISGVYGNVIVAYYSYDDYTENPSNTKQWLNANVFLSDTEYDSFYYGCYSNTFGNDCYSNTFGNDCYSNTFGNDCYSNTFGNDCYSNTFRYNCYSNTFGNDCHSNTFGNDCYSNTFGNDCYSNTFGNDCNSNTFGNDCYSNTFGNDCYENTFGDNCHSNTFGDGCNSNTFRYNYYSNTFRYNCYSNTFGNDCYSNTFGNDCYSNTFGNDCHSNTFGNDCNYNTFGDGCHSNTFGNDCNYNTFGDGCNYNTFGDGCNYNTFGDGCNYNTFGENCRDNEFNKAYSQYITIENGVNGVDIDCAQTTSSTTPLKNVHINSGVKGTTIIIPTAGNEFLTTVGKADDVKINV